MERTVAMAGLTERGPALDGRYALAELLGTGGVAHVHRAWDLLLERYVAVKIFGPGIDPSGPERQRVEMRILAGLSHANLVTVYDAGTDSAHHPPRAYLVMALIDGPSLSTCLRAGRLPPERVQQVAIDIATALAYVHSRDVVHRDVKPANILLDQKGTAFLADFGIAQSIGATALTAVGDTVGTAAYLSPEQVRGHEVTGATDVYAFGLVLLEALTGEREYPGSTAETALVRLSRSPRVDDRVPAAWQDLLAAMTGPDPQARPTSAELRPLLEAVRARQEGSTTHVLGSLGAREQQQTGRTRVLNTGSFNTETPTVAAGHPGVDSPPLVRRRNEPTRTPQAGWRRPRFLALVAAAVVIGVSVVLVGTSLHSPAGPASRTVPDPTVGTPGPTRLGPDLTRLQQLVQP